VITRYPTVIYGLKVKKHKPQSGIKDKSRTTSEKFDLNIWNRPRVNSKILKKLVCFLPCGKAEYTAYPSLPRVCGSTLQLRPRTPCRSEAEIPLAGDLPAKPGSKEQHPRLLQRWGLRSLTCFRSRQVIWHLCIFEITDYVTSNLQDHLKIYAPYNID